MYESPITLMTQRMNAMITEKLEGEVLKAVVNVGVVVDKEELMKALSYDREQYIEGYTDRDNEIVRCKECIWHRTNTISEWCAYFGHDTTESDFCSRGEWS